MVVAEALRVCLSACVDHEKDTVSNFIARIDDAGDGLFFFSDT